jgi:putative tryptophan/tyrosine transport system substrate-binding protein
MRPSRARLRSSRRAFLAAVAAATVALASRTQAQAPPKMLRVAYVGLQPRQAPIYAAFEAHMAELGYHAGKNFVFDYVQAPSIDAYPGLYAELVARKATIIVCAGGEPALRAAQAAPGALPIVLLAIDFDPLQKGYVASLARPGGTITGIFVQQLDLARKRVELVREALPQATQLGLLSDASSRDQAEAAAATARHLGLAPRLLELSGEPPDYAGALAPMAQVPGEPVAIPASAVFLRDRAAIGSMLRERRIPAIAALRENAEAGALMSYGVELVDLFRDIAGVVDRVARGAKPGEVPIEPPTHFRLAINLRTAAALGIALPGSFTARADEVIE